MVKVIDVPSGSPMIQMFQGAAFYQGHLLYDPQAGTTRYGTEILAAAALIQEAAARNGHTALLECIEQIKAKIRN
jgi:hypothetical protein